MFNKILIANRGEIACRVIRTARGLGYRAVAVFSDADANAPHVSLADEAVHIGPSPAAESYLKIDAILAAAKRAGADAIHPGYGFLSENAAFAQACADAGVTFIGPPASAINAMGDKARAKARMIEAGVPCAPGYLGAEQSDGRMAEEATRIGFPLLVKAVAGGGGRGIRVVRHIDELAPALAGARREAQSAFGDATLMLEWLIESGRHIEIQVFADNHGNAVYLGERDCTAQRRRQKVIEEAPSPVVSASMREHMGKDAVAAALAVGYRGAGTVEFIVDAELNHYFLEMNTRLQVEHPVTEMVTGFDLVEWQLRVAAGEPLPARQQDIRITGHAIEARLYAEDPYENFTPQTGPIAYWRPERAMHAGVRVDDGICEGGEVTPFYDAMVAKLIVHGRDRTDAIRRLTALLEDAPLLGLANNSHFLRDLINHPRFVDASMTTTLIDEWQLAGEALLARPAIPEEAWALAAALLTQASESGWRSAGVAAFTINLVSGNASRTLRVAPHAGGTVVVHDGGAVRHVRVIEHAHGQWQAEIDGLRRKGVGVMVDGALHLVIDAATFVFREPSANPAALRAEDPARILAPASGLLAQLLVKPGDSVAAGQNLACVEAMKMEMWLSAKVSGTVAAVHAKAGEQVTAKALVIEIEPGAA